MFCNFGKSALSMKNEHQKLMHSLKAQHQVLIDLMGRQTVDYLDIPIHGNGGDNLIFLGVLGFLRNAKVRLSSISSVYNFCSHASADVLLLHGGGNFGDIYPLHQKFRERVVLGNLNKRIIVLPQTVHFADENNLAASRKIFAQHPDLHLFVRDEKSLALAQGFTPNLALMPDMAHQLYPLQACPSTAGKTLHQKSTLYFKRQDQEAAEGSAPLAQRESIDWADIGGAQGQRQIRHYQKHMKWLAKLGLERRAQAYLARRWERIAQEMATAAVQCFSQHEHIVTDRLHGHLLAMLLDKSNTVLDNSYGKNSSYLQCWTGASPLVQWQGATSAGV